ncbi:MAG TPA: histidine kinase [Saprospiraceae bacterium]|nr:histidine kinase [Saprospiraceae bacterium]HMQ84323.1 histidine kinase [Saprospiraceae bacterium]
MPLQDLLEKSSFLESVIHSAPMAMVVLDENLDIVMINPRGCNYLDVKKDNVIGQPLLEHLDSPLKDWLLSRIPAGDLDFDLPEVKLGQRYVIVRCRSVQPGVLLTFMNISKLKEMEIATYNAMLDGQEAERRRLAREIHDGIGPLLSALKLNIEYLQPPDEQLDAEHAARFQQVMGMMDQMAEELRHISHALMPAALLDFGLNTALQQLCSRVSLKGKTKVAFFSNDPERRLEPAIELGLYRIGQELINNALKHAAASEITLQLIRHEKTLVLMVEDDGKGFDPSKQPDNFSGLGLGDIQARAKSLQGQFTLEAAPGQGVLATIEVPVE